MYSYPQFFEQLTDHSPFPYQVRLGSEPWPTVLDVPTGLGKTAAVIAAWLYKRLHADPQTGRRLIYCLPMRVLVEQTVGVARQLCERASATFADAGLRAPSVHVLMGGDLDQEWESAPAGPAVLVGTQDMLLSRALGRGFGMSRYKWPIHFALLNNDCSWVFDETQLMGVGLVTGAQLQGLREKLGAYGALNSLWMSATLEERQLATVDHPEPSAGWISGTLTKEDMGHDVVRSRVAASKSLERLDGIRLETPAGEESYVTALAGRVAAEHSKRLGLTLVIVNRVHRAQAVYRALLDAGASTAETALLHSRFRRIDRERHEAILIDSRGPRIVVATQAVEAGVDVSARTMFSELAPWPSLVQRFGRCNRYGDDDGAIFWADIDTSDQKSGLPLPYESSELDTARRLLEDLTGSNVDVGPANLRNVTYDAQQAVRPVIRRRDVLDLFDTTPDLSGCDIDVSRYVRDGDDTDVQFYWRAFEAQPLATAAPPQRRELCGVSVGAARAFMKKLAGTRRKAKNHTARFAVWRWSGLDKAWQEASDEQVYGGQILLLHLEAGGYAANFGWTGQVGSCVPEPHARLTGASETNVGDYYEGDPGTTYPERWVLLRDHLGHVRDEATALALSVGLGEFTEVLSTAGLWHDVGKAHDVFQRRLLDPVANLPDLQPAADGIWAKSGHRLLASGGRKLFRHELASALAWLAAGDGSDSRFTDLVAYLIAAHHGKVRLSIRSMPGETRPDHPERLFARGVWDGDVLTSFELPDGRTFENVALDLAVMRLGAGSWLERVLALRDAADIGPFRLALLETIVRIADWRASAKEKVGAYGDE